MLTRAAQLASLSSSKVYKHGAIIVKGGAVLSSGWNGTNDIFFCNRTNTYIRLHAETSALKSCSSTKGVDVYVSRILANGSLAMSRPCEMCQAYAFMVGASRVFYSINDKYYGIYKPNVATHATLRGARSIKCLYSGIAQESILRR